MLYAKGEMVEYTAAHGRTRSARTWALITGCTPAICVILFDARR